MFIYVDYSLYSVHYPSQIEQYTLQIVRYSMYKIQGIVYIDSYIMHIVFIIPLHSSTTLIIVLDSYMHTTYNVRRSHCTSYIVRHTLCVVQHRVPSVITNPYSTTPIKYQYKHVHCAKYSVRCTVYNPAQNSSLHECIKKMGE